MRNESLCTARGKRQYNQKLSAVSWQQQIVLLLWVKMCQTFVLFNSSNASFMQKPPQSISALQH